MVNSDSDDDVYDDIEFENASEGDEDIDEDIIDALEGDLTAAVAAEGTEGEEDTDTSTSDNGSDDEDVYEDYVSPHKDLEQVLTQSLQEVPSLSKPPSPATESPTAGQVPQPPPQIRPPSPAQIRKTKLLSDIRWPRSFTVEAICAIPHPCATHALASSLCMTHLITGSDDGYIRDYDVFAAVNGKIFLTAPQRQHCGVIEGIMKAGQIRCWWENAIPVVNPEGPNGEAPLYPVYSLAMQSDALWSLAGSDQGHVCLHTVRHSPGRLCHVMHGHRGPVSALSLQHDEKGFFSAGWDGEAIHWDLNTGQMARRFSAHGAQLAGVAVRPLSTNFIHNPYNTITAGSEFTVSMRGSRDDQQMNHAPSMPPPPPPQALYQAPKQEDDVKSEASYDPLFDEPDAEGDGDGPGGQNPYTSFPGYGHGPPNGQHLGRGAIAPKGAPPVLDPTTYATFSPDLLMTAHVDGQVILWDRRVNTPGRGVGRLWMSEKTPPWLMSACWSADGAQIYAGRRNGTVEIYDVRQTGRAASGTPKILKTLRNPGSSGVVSCVVAFPDGRHLACASTDNIRLWNVAEAGEPDASGKMKSGVQFKIIPGHHGGYVSQMLVDPAARFLVSASSNRGWHGEHTKTVFVHEVKHQF
ncbi:WD40 repeat-like protein [Dichomitus squalens LYAD-421 SS1]|uniref:WD40 repeat-like protein n=1 Tax=Dichomitus squalens (strain LYAD-421) TaxID=732165 RepID=UPI00044147B2|nr:WD40 repeat-like protein [Dichomitus squalens LYAD-421 SS1]EJF65877.1 WD40 repeat-like protein [Dichomitus squalens LYAD-421 SS1]